MFLYKTLVEVYDFLWKGCAMEKLGNYNNGSEHLIRLQRQLQKVGKERLKLIRANESDVRKIAILDRQTREINNSIFVATTGQEAIQYSF